jgi:serine/threonine-protein kinase
MVAENEGEPVAKITDFGIARAPVSAVKTMTGTILGSPRYMSPEQVVGKNVGPRSDIFSLGVVLYEMLAGTAPFDADSVSSIMYQTVHVPPEPLSALNRNIPPALEAIVARSLAKTPEERFETMRELGKALREVARALPEPKPLPRPGDEALVSDVTSPSRIARAVDYSGDDETSRGLSRGSETVEGTLRLDDDADRTALEIESATGSMPPARPSATPSPATPANEPFPVGAAALLGTLAAIALALGVMLAF